jgi:hypothetical protein
MTNSLNQGGSSPGKEETKPGSHIPATISAEGHKCCAVTLAHTIHIGTGCPVAGQPGQRLGCTDSQNYASSSGPLRQHDPVLSCGLPKVPQGVRIEDSPVCCAPNGKLSSGSLTSSIKYFLTERTATTKKHTNSLIFIFTVCLLSLVTGHADGSREAKRLFDDLLSDYNRLIRPVGNNSHKVIITVGLKLSQLIDINLKHQVMTTNIWLEQEWEDYKLKWNPTEYGGVDMIHVPAENIWLPDIVLFNNADGNYEVILMNKATVYSTGKVVWKPPALYKSTCEIDVEYFPFDEQNCLMKFASWTYDGFEVCTYISSAPIIFDISCRKFTRQ